MKWWEHVIFWGGLIGFGSILVCSSSCAYTKEMPTEQIGLCSMPPEDHDGAKRVGCATLGGKQAWCDYTYQGFTLTNATKDCVNWELLGAKGPEEAPQTEEQSL